MGRDFENSFSILSFPPETGSFGRRGLANCDRSTKKFRKSTIYARPLTSQGVFEGPIKFDEGLANRICIYLSSRIDTDFRFLKIPDDFISVVGNELKRFACAIQAYADSYKEPIMSKKDLIHGILDKNYSLYLKRLKYKSYIFSSGCVPMEFPEWWDDIPSIRIFDIGEIFNYNYWFRWQEQEPEDLDYSFIDVESNSIPEDFIDSIHDILPEVRSSWKSPILNRISSRKIPYSALEAEST